MFEKIVFIAPYEGLKNIGDEVIREMNIDIDSYAGDLHIGLSNAKKLLKREKRLLLAEVELQS